ncbi:MAG: hypothetical protein LBL62_06430 [Planctomycetaceae bacterium]|nr:hypothetical protein [Planctomycetaceae bacterium]
MQEHQDELRNNIPLTTALRKIKTKQPIKGHCRKNYNVMDVPCTPPIPTPRSTAITDN